MGAELVETTYAEHDFGPAAMVMLYAGLRRGEVLYLDVDRMWIFRRKRSLCAARYPSARATVRGHEGKTATMPSNHPWPIPGGGLAGPAMGCC